MTKISKENCNERYCESCDQPFAKMHPELLRNLCDLCLPWVEKSLQRTENIPSWTLEVAQNNPDLVMLIRHMVYDNAIHSENWTSGSDIWRPSNDQGWLELFHWILGENAQVDTLQKSLSLREATRGTAESVTGLANQMNQQELVGDDSIHEDGWGTWVNGILFGPEAEQLHCQHRDILPELLFDRFHGLDHRPIDEMAHAYLKGPWMDFIGSSTRVRVPTTPAIREFVHRMAMREFGETSANRLHATFALWAIHPEREYESCAPEVWARSFAWIHEIARDSNGRIRFGEEGIFVDGESRNLYLIAPSDVPRDQFAVYKVARIGDQRTPPICIHTKGEKTEVKMAMGDIVASLVLALLDDVESAQHIHTLQVLLPEKYHSNFSSRMGLGWGERAQRRRANRRRELQDARRAEFQSYDPDMDIEAAEE